MFTYEMHGCDHIKQQSEDYVLVVSYIYSYFA